MSEVKSDPTDMAKILLATAENESQSVHIESDILDPATSTTTPGGETIFNIRRKGVINSGSAVHITITGVDAKQRLTTCGGALALIERAELRTSKGVVICQSDKINQLATLRNRFLEQEIREKKMVYKNGTYEIYETLTDPVSTLEGKTRLKGDYDGNNGDKPIQYVLATNTIEYQISLSELFPEALAYQLPVFAIDGNLQLVLTWAAYKVRGVASDGDPASVDGTNHINITKCIYVSDHLFFDGKTMAMLQNQINGKGMLLPYNDFNIAEFALQSPNTAIGAGAGQEKEFRQFMGLSNMRLKYILLQMQQDGSAWTTNNAINGVFNSRGSFKGGSDSDREGGDVINVIINNKQHYPIDWSTDNLLYSALEGVYKSPLALPRNLYTSVGAVADQTLIDAGGTATNLNAISTNVLIAGQNYYNHTQSTQLLASAHYIGINMSTISGPVPNTGKKVGFTPIEFKFKRYFSNGNDHDLTMRAFCCVERIMVLKGGQVMVNYS